MELYNYVMSKVKDQSVYYILLDEVQLVNNFESVLNSFLKKSNLDVYVTGSNSKFLSSDIVTEFRGRSTEIKVYPLSFLEFVELKGISVDDAWNEYILYGGLPPVVLQENEKQKREYLLNLFETTYLKDIIEIPIYTLPEWTMGYSFGEYIESIKSQYPMLSYEMSEQIIKVSDYNKIAELYGEEQYTLNDDEYIVLCNYDQMEDIRNQTLNTNSNIEIKGKTYHSKYNECKDGFVYMATSEMNAGIILVPDNFELKNEDTEQYLLVANYNAETEEGKQEIEKTIAGSEDTEFFKNIEEKGIDLDGLSKITIIESSKGLATIIIFIAIYLGIIFLIASSAILALKQLTESSDNKQRYTILRKIGCDEKMINKALFRQIFIFFMMPLIIAMIHSIFGIKFILSMLEVLASPDELLPSIIVTAIIMGAIYGVYFLATYFGSKNIIKEEE